MNNIYVNVEQKKNCKYSNDSYYIILKVIERKWHFL